MNKKQEEKLKNHTSEQEFERIWGELNHNQRRFVVQMAECSTKKEAAEIIEIGEHTVYGWPDIVDRAVELYQKNIARAASDILADSVAKAALIKVAGLDSGDEKIRQLSSSEILDRYFGKATQKTEVTGEGGGPVEHTIREIVVELPPDEPMED